MKERIGSTAGFVDDHLVVCGGYSPEDKAYLNMCQTQGGKFWVFSWKHLKYIDLLKKELSLKVSKCPYEIKWSLTLSICTLIFEQSSLKNQVRQTGFLTYKNQFRNQFL